MSQTLEEKTKVEIRRGIELGTNIQNIIEQIEKVVVGKKLSYIDLSYVKRKYIHYVMKLWLKEVSEFLQSNPEDDKINEIINLINRNDLKLKDITQSFTNSKFSNRFNDVVINSAWEYKILFRFRGLCIREISNFEYAIEEIKFVNKVIDIITSSNEGNRDFLRQLKYFVTLNGDFRKLLKDILNTNYNLENFVEIKNSSKILIERERFYFEKKIRDCLKQVFSDVSIEMKNGMNRTYLEIFGGVIFISNYLLEIERKILESKEITEIHIVSPFAIHIDISLKQDIWHGKNLVLHSKKIYIRNEVEINVSGNDGNDIDTIGVDGVSQGEDGKDGRDGNCGESGGNVVIMADEICLSNNLVIISNGGAGSNGQNGGNGNDGANGIGLTKLKMIELFPSFAKFLAHEANGNQVEALKNLKEKCDKIINITSPNEGIIFMGDMYVEGESILGEQFIISSYNGIFIKYCYFLCKGSQGKNGGAGGKFGFGGESGHEGNIEILQSQPKAEKNYKIVTKCVAGRNGDNGKAGTCGKPGLNGWDMGYADQSNWAEARYYGEDQQTKLRVAVNSDFDDSVYCFKNKCKCDIRCSSSIYDTQKNFEQTTNKSQKKQREQNSISDEKKNISKESIRDNYSTLLNCDLLSDLMLNFQKLCHISTLASNINVEIHENNQTTINDMCVATYSRDINYKRQSIQRENSMSIAQYKLPIHNFNHKFYSIYFNPIVSENMIYSNDINERVKQLEILKFKLKSRGEKSLLTIAQSQYLYAMKRQKLLGFNANEFIKRVYDFWDSKKSQEHICHGKNVVYKSKYLDPLDNKTSETKVNCISKILPYFTDSEREKQQNASKLINYIKSFFDTKASDNLILENKQYIDEFVVSFIRDNKEENIDVFGRCLTYIETNLSETKKMKNEEGNAGIDKDTDGIRVYSSINMHENSEKVNRTSINYQLTKGDTHIINWSEYTFHRDMFNAMHAVFSKHGCTLPSYRDIVSFKESISYYFIDFNAEEEHFSLHNILSSKEVDPIFVCSTTLGFEARVFNAQYFNLDMMRIYASNRTDQILSDMHNLASKDAINSYHFSDKFISENPKIEVCNSDITYIQFLENIFESENYKELLPFLNKISKKYLNPPNLLLFSFYNVFQVESIRLPTEVFKIIITEVIEAYVYDLSTYNTLAWIVSTTDQIDWISEIIYLQIENFCKKCLKNAKKGLINSLRKLDVNTSISLYQKLKDENLTESNLKDVTSIIEILGTITNFDLINLGKVNLIDWKYVLAIELYKVNLKIIFPRYRKESLMNDSYLATILCNSIGDYNVRKLFETLKFVKGIKSSKCLSILLMRLINGDYDFIKCLEYMSEKKCLTNLEQDFRCEKNRDIERINDIIASNFNNSISVKDILKATEIIVKKVNNAKENKTDCETCKLTCPKDLSQELFLEYKKSRQDFHNFNLNEITSHVNKYSCVYKSLEINTIIIEILSLFDTAVQHTRNFKLRDTQKAAIVLMLLNKNNILAQVSTGEGKSLIVTAVAIIKALNGSTVDICTSSTLLAKRDAESEPPKGYKDLYQIFNIPVSHNCSDDVDKRKRAYAENVVIYGQISNFQRDYLLDTFYNKNMLGDRKYETIIIDEVDSMLLDKGNNMLYLSHDLPGLDRLEKLYVFLWQIISSTKENLSRSNVKDIIENTIFKKIIKNDLGFVHKNLTKCDINNIWNGLCKSNVIDEIGILKVERVEELTENQFLTSEYEVYKDRIIYFIDTHIKIKPPVTVPNYLIEFVMIHLDRWIENAMIAYLMVEGTDYVVDVDRTKSHPDRYPMITILDRDTGTDLGNSQWDESLHQFLQIKHGCKLSLQKLKAVFISNVSFFKKYEKLYGLTGTLGSKVERELLTEIYSVDFVTVPTSKLRKFKEHVPIVCTDSKSWLRELANKTKLRISNGQSVLIIFDTIREMKEVHSFFRKINICNEIKVYQRDYEEFDLTQGNRDLDSGVVILATNLAGRGADIKLTKNVVDAGGLHVIVSYLPKNCRIEQQAFGRASRCGDPGSGQLVFIAEVNIPIIKHKSERDIGECLRLGWVKDHYQKNIKIQEKYLELFTEALKKVKDNEDLQAPDDIKFILLKSCLNKWTFWLDLQIKLISDEEKHEEINKSFKCFLDTINNLKYRGPHSKSDTATKNSINNEISFWCKWTDDPFIKVQIAKTLFKLKHFDEALEIFDSVIKSEPHCNEMAHYYKSAIYISQIDWEKKKLDSNRNIYFDDNVNSNLYKTMKVHLLSSKQKFEDLKQESLLICAILDEIKNNKLDHVPSIVEVDALREQKETTSHLYGYFINSIDDIIGHTISGQNFVTEGIDSFTGEKVYNMLQPCFNSAVINKDYSKQELILIAEKNLLDVTSLENFLQNVHYPFQLPDFENKLKEILSIPCREEFWDILIKYKFLNNFEEFVVLDYKMLKSLDPSLYETLKEKVDNRIIICAQFDEDKKPVVFKYNFNICAEESDLFGKSHLISIIGDKRYKFLLKNSVLSLNVKAEVDISQKKNVVFNRCDSVYEQDFDSKLIPKADLDLIIKSLCDNQILCKSANGSFKLFKSDVNFIPKEIVLYNQHILRVLKNKFLYRSEMDLIVNQVKSKKIPILLSLKSNPYSNLLSDLIDSNILEMPNVVEDSDKIKFLVEQNMSFLTSFDKFKSDLFEFVLISNENEFKTLLNELTQKQWLKPLKSDQSLHKNKSAINISDNHEKLKLNEISCRNVLSDEFKTINLTLSLILNNKLNLSSDIVSEHISTELVNAKSNLYCIKNPVACLKSITEFKLEGRFTLEMENFILNGCEHIIILDEKRYTSKFFRDVVFCTALGLAQCALGLALNVYCPGIMFHFGSVLIAEGISDILFAVSSLETGQFSWAEYRKQKLISISMRVSTFGIAGILTKATQFSRYGNVIAKAVPKIKDGLAIGTGMETDAIMSVGRLQLLSSGGKQIAKQLGQAVISAGYNYFVDDVIKNNMQSLCQKIGSHIISEIDRNIHNNEINDVIKELITTFGPTSAKSQITTSVEKHFSKGSEHSNEFLNHIFQLLDSAASGISKYLKENSLISTANNIDILSIITKIAPIAQKITTNTANLLKIKITINNVLKDISKELNEKIQEIKSKNQICVEKVDDMDVLRCEILELLKTEIKRMAGQIVEDNLVAPLLKLTLNKVTEITNKSNKASFKKIRNYIPKNMSEPSKTGFTNDVVSSSIYYDHIMTSYNENVIKLMKMCRMPELLSDIIKENIPMDATCIRDSLNIICNMLDVKNLSAEIMNRLGESQSFTVGSELKGNILKFVVDGNDDNTVGSNSLFAALIKQIPMLNGLTLQQFRNQVIDFLVNDPDIRHQIENSWDSFVKEEDFVGNTEQIERNNRTENVQMDDLIDWDGYNCTEKVQIDDLIDRERNNHTENEQIDESIDNDSILWEY